MLKIRVRVTENGQILDEQSDENGYKILDEDGADFLVNEDGTLELMRWPRNIERAILPESINGKTVAGIFPLAFAAFHVTDATMDKFWKMNLLSFSTFCMMNAGEIKQEKSKGEGPREIILPDSIQKIGAYAFWRCTCLQKIRLPKNLRKIECGTFGQCYQLEMVCLPEQLEEIGSIFSSTVQVMPDVGAFFGCSNLKRIVLPQTLLLIGQSSFNSSGLEEVCIFSGSGQREEDVVVHNSAFQHTAKLQWLSKLDSHAEIIWQIGLPEARDKILTCDATYSEIFQIPEMFFQKEPKYFDELAKKCFRLDFSGRMAIARLRYPYQLSTEMEQWYVKMIVDYYEQLEKFWPQDNEKERKAFELVCNSNYFTVEMLAKMMYTAGMQFRKPELLYQMTEERNLRFSRSTGLEDLEL